MTTMTSSSSSSSGVVVVGLKRTQSRRRSVLVRASSSASPVAGRSEREATKDALRACIANASAPDVIERRASALEAYYTPDDEAYVDVETNASGTWRVLYTNAPPPSDGTIGPLRGESFQVVDASKRRYENVLSVPPESWLRVVLRARYEPMREVDERTWMVRFEDVTVRLFDRFDAVKKKFDPNATTRIWQTTYLDENCRIVRAGRTEEAVREARARGRKAKAGDEDDCLFVMVREVPWWELPTGI